MQRLQLRQMLLSVVLLAAIGAGCRGSATNMVLCPWFQGLCGLGPVTEGH